MPHQHRQRHHGSIALRRPRAARPGCEALEGRALLAVSALDPTFGQRGITLGPVAPNPPGAYLQDSSASVVQDDGKVVVVTGYSASTLNGVGLAVERYGVDGQLDAGFGVNGTAIVPVPAGYNTFGADPGVALAPDGSLVVAAGVARSSFIPGATSPSQESVIARLTPAGQLDATFAQGGEYLVTAPGAAFGHVAVQPDGKIVAAGGYAIYGGDGPPQITAIRLTAAGAPDPTFHGTGRVDLIPASLNTRQNDFIEGLALAPDGRIDVVSDLADPIPIEGGGPGTSATVLSRINADGTPDATFGTGGTLDVTSRITAVYGLVVQPDGAVILGGFVSPTRDHSFQGLVRFLDDGQVDPTFQTTRLDSAGGPDTFGSSNALALGADGDITVVGRASSTGVRLADGSYTGGANRLAVKRYHADGTPDTTFGTGGTFTFYAAPTATPSATIQGDAALTGVSLTRTGQVVATGRIAINQFDASGRYLGKLGDQLVLARLNTTTATPAPTAGDFDGDGKADIAAQLTNLGILAVHPSGGGTDRIDPFGAAGFGGAIPVTGDYDGDGRADIAAYLPNLGILAYRPSSGGTDVYVRFGSAGFDSGTGAPASIPVAGDFDGDGKTDVAVYLPAYAAFAIHPSGGGMDELIPFGKPGIEASLPAVGDYDGDGRADAAVYLPDTGELAVRPSAGGPDVVVAFGSAGLHASIPTPGDFDGDGKADIAVYLPAYAAFAVHPSGGGLNDLVPFGRAGDGASIPAVADYDGDGKADPAVYLPADGLFADRPSTGGGDVVRGFGLAGGGSTLPAAASYPRLPSTINPGGLVVAAALDIPLTPADVAALDAATAAKKKA